MPFLLNKVPAKDHALPRIATDPSQSWPSTR
jgi:hypothetical protein